MNATLYLAAPAFLFLLGFCRLAIGLPLAVLLAAALLMCWRARRAATPITGVGVALAAAALMAWIAGFPAGPFPSDWIKHWALLQELSARNWPVEVSLQQTPMQLRFYVGAYLVPAGLAKLSGLPTWIFTGLWFTLGYALVFSTLTRNLTRTTGMPRNAVLAMLAVILLLGMAGADAYAEHFFRALLGLPNVPWLGIHPEAWQYNANRMPLEYTSVLSALAWVPHQAIATYLVVGLLASPQAQQPSPAVLALAAGLLALWSPYGLIGLLPMLLVSAWQRRDEICNAVTALCMLAASLFALLVAWYLSTDLNVAGTCMACLPQRLRHLGDFLPFLLVELGPFALILRGQLLRDRLNLAALLTLLLVPLLHGETPDFVMRASLGPLFLLALRSVQALLDWQPGHRHQLSLLAALALSMPTAASELVYLRQGAAAHRELAPTDPLSARWMRLIADQRSYSAQEFLDLCGWQFMGQYFTTEHPAALRDPPKR